MEKSPLQTRWAIVLIVLLSFSIHLPGLNSPLLDYHAYRQCQTASMARNYVRHGMHFLRPELDDSGFPQRAGTEFPIYSYLLAVLYCFFGVHEVLGRLLSCFWAAWGAVFLFLFVRRRLGESTAFWSACVLCMIPVHVYFTRSVQPEPMALWGLLGFLYTLDRWLSDEQPCYGFSAMLLGALAPLLKLPFLYLIFPLWMVLGIDRRGRTIFRHFSFLGIMAGILLLTEAWYHYAKTAPITVLPLTFKEHIENLRPLLTLNLWQAHFISRLPELCFTYSGIILGWFGFLRLRKEHQLPLWGAWFLITALYIVLLGQYGLIHRYTELPWAPIAAVFVASGIVTLWQNHSRHLGWRIALILLVLGIPIHAFFRIKHWYKLDNLWLLRAQPIIGRLTTPRDLLVTNTREHPVLLYYLDRYGYAPNLEETGLDAIEEAKRQGARYLLTPTGDSWSRHPEWAKEMAGRYPIVYRDRDFLIYQLSF